MKAIPWTNYGFWLVTGLALGMLISDVAPSASVKADSASRVDEYCMVSGKSFDGEIDCIWLLDYKQALLHCLVLSRQGNIMELGRVDLIEQLELNKAGGRRSPHFMMITGRFGTRGTDFCYLAETDSGQILCIEPPNVGGAVPGQIQSPKIISRFRFRAAD